MKKIIYILLLIVMTACSSDFTVSTEDPVIKLNISPKKKKIAVITFNIKGSFISRKLGEYAANRFSEELYYKLNAKTIDRSFVREAEKKLNIEKAKSLNEKKLKELLNELSADIIIVGEIEQLGYREPLSGKYNYLIMNFRALNGKGEIEGIGSIKGKYKGIAEKFIDEAIEKIIQNIGSKN